MSKIADPSHTSIPNHRAGYAITTWAGQLLLIVQMIVVTIILARLHKLVPCSVNDTPGYLNFPFDSLKESLNSIRTPGYPVFLKVVAWCGSLSMVAWAHWACYCVAVEIFYYGLRRIGLSPLKSALISGALLSTNILHGYVQFIATDTLAAAVVIALMGLLLVRCGGGCGTVNLLAIGTATTLAWLFRPANLFLVLLVPLLAGLLAVISRPRLSDRRPLAETLRQGLATLSPFVAYCLFRWAVVGTFGIVSFGGYNLVGVSGQFLDAMDIPRLPADLQPLARAALQKKSMLNPQSIPMTDADRLNYMRMELNYDVMIWQIFAPAAREVYGENNRIINVQLRRLAFSIIRLHPVDYAIWLAKALRQGVRKIVSDFVVNPVGLALSLLTTFAVLANIIRGHRRDFSKDLVHRQDRATVGILFAIAVCYAAAALVLVIAVCPPLGRFTDAMAVFFPSLMTAVLLNQLETLFPRGACFFSGAICVE